MLFAVWWHSVSPLMWSQRFHAFMTNSMSFSTLLMARSPPSTSITNAHSPFNSVNPSLSGCLRCSLRKPTQFLVIWFKPISIGLEQSIPKSMFVLCRWLRHTLQASYLLMFWNLVSQRIVIWSLQITWRCFVFTFSCLGNCLKWRWRPRTTSGLSCG